MLQLNLRFFYGGCVACSDNMSMSDAPLNGQEWHYLRLARGKEMAIAWVPDPWVARLLCHVEIP